MKKKKKPVSSVPTVPDLDSKPAVYNERDEPRSEDRMPEGGFKRLDRVSSKAELRLRVEELLTRREAPPSEDWLQLGEGARDILVRLLDDVVVGRREALKQRVIATLGQLQVARAVPQLGELLLRQSEDAVTRAHAASALGRIGDARVIPFLGQAVAAKDEMVRRQVARALGTARHPNAVPHLLRLLDDKSKHISGAAAAELQTYERELGLKLGIKLKPVKEGEKQTKRTPATDE